MDRQAAAIIDAAKPLGAEGFDDSSAESSEEYSVETLEESDDEEVEASCLAIGGKSQKSQRTP